MRCDEELEIDLKDLLFWLLRFWYVLIACLLMGAVLGGAFAYYKNASIGHVVPEKEIEKLVKEMTPKEKKDVDEIVSLMEYAKDMKTQLASEMSVTSYQGDDLEDAIKRVDYWKGVYNEQYGLAAGLKEEQKDYYDLLTADPDKQIKEESIPKYAVIGAMFLFCIACFCFCLAYIFTPTVKTPDELCSIFGYPVLRTLSAHELDVAMLSTDISILIKNSSFRSLGIICDNTTKKESGLAEQLSESVKKSGDTTVVVVYPLSSPEGLKNLSSCDSVVLFVTAKETRRPRLQEIISYCNRYGCIILGFVTLEPDSKRS